MATATKPRKAKRQSKGLAVTISREQLQEVLAAVTVAVPSRATLPILMNVLIETTDRGIRVSATDLDLWLSADAVADVEQPGAVTVPAKRLLDIAKELPPSPVRITEGETAQVRVDCGRSEFRLYGLPREEFPASPKVAEKSVWQIAAGDIQAVIPKVSFCVSREESRPILNGVLWQMRKGSTRLAATNGHRLAVVERKVKIVGEPFREVIIPPKTLAQIARLFAAEDEIDIANSDMSLMIRSATREIRSRVIEGPYPNYEQVIPKDFARVARADRIALVASIRRVLPLSDDQNHRLKLHFSTANVKLSSEKIDCGDAHDELPVHYAGEDFEIGVNASYLLDILNAIDTDEVSIRMNEVQSAIGVDPVDLPAGVQSYILMPLRLVD